MSLVGAVRSEVLAVDRNQPISQVKTMERLMADSITPQRFSLLLIGIFAGMALVLATAGIYGVISYTAGQRTHEIGVRMAMGAQRRDLVWMVARESLAIAAVGAVAGLPLTFFATRALSSLLYGLAPTDAVAFCLGIIGIGIVTVVASVAPALRAASMNPVIALRYE
jgi:putative ABC transport system permease protein